MALTARQTLLYTHRCDIWRFSQTIAIDGTPSAKAWSKIGSSVACYFEFTESQHAPNEFVLGEADNIFTLDIIHFEAGTDVRSGDVLKQTTGPSAGDFWTVRGGDKPKARRANKLSVRASKDEKAPNGVS